MQREVANRTLDLARARLLVRGVVQGVGFRPFIHRLAHEYGFGGWVLNSTEGVVIEIEGPGLALAEFARDVRDKAPPRAVVESVEAVTLPPVGYAEFTIEKSAHTKGELSLVSPDIATCDECLGELLTPSNRRHRYPFINCTNCGPRFTIVKNVPYDRPQTTMAAFAMCEPCAAEYHDPSDRRFHAQPNACPACGPLPWLCDRTGRVLCRDDEAIAATRRLIGEGAIVAVKGIGGFHLACDATSDAAVARLRERKHRVEKPFAVMLPDLAAVEFACDVTLGERQLLTSPARPIVLLRRRGDSAISHLVAPRNPRLGVMLPYTPLHHLLLAPGRRETALVMTSGNLSEEPIARGNEEALARLGDLADGFLMHDREIHVSCDDSVTQVFAGREILRRRARGYAPFPVRLPFEVGPSLAVGPHLKNTFCLARDRYAFVSHHIGDLENEETVSAWELALDHYSRLFCVEPALVAHDLHPGYLSTRLAAGLGRRWGRSVRLEPVQHHHAHVASCLADNGRVGPVIGVAFDGTGFGTDGQVWGGEFLVADFARFERAAHLRYAPMPGGEAAIERPWRMALAYVRSLEPGLVEPSRLFSSIAHFEISAVKVQIERGLNTPLTSSMGRLFDGVSAILGLCERSTFEGQPAIELEAAADLSIEEGYDWAVPARGKPLVLDWAGPVARVVADAASGIPAGVIAARFHNGVADMVAKTCLAISRRTGIEAVVLSGGVFQNVLLLERTLARLRAVGLDALVHHQVPCNDGGVSLGQVAIACARVNARRRGRASRTNVQQAPRRKEHVLGRSR